MKILAIDYDYYYYPEFASNLEEFIAYANEHYNSFIRLTTLKTDKCEYPYFVSEDTKEVYCNIASISEIAEEDVTILNRSEYDARLKEVVKTKCIDCVNYIESCNGDNLDGHREKLSLDGECWEYEKAEPDDE